MKLKRMIAVIMSIIMITAAFTCAGISVSAAEADLIPSGAENEAVIKVFFQGDQTYEFRCKVGHTFTVTAYLDTHSIDGGRITSVEGSQTFSTDKLQLADELYTEDDSREIYDTERVFPVMGDYAIGNLDDDDILYFAGSKTDKRNPYFFFDSPYSELIVTTYKVIDSGEAEIRTNLITLAKADSDNIRIISRSQVNSNYAESISFSSERSDTDSYSLTKCPEIVPTASADGRIEHWKCEDCGGLFGDQDGTIPITDEETVIKHQRVIGQTLLLKDEIGVRYYLYVPELFFREGNTVTVDFTWGTGNYLHSSSGTLSPANLSGANYKATCYVEPDRMTDRICLSLKVNGSEILRSDRFRIVDYAKNASSNYNDDENLKKLLCYMLEYGTSVQNYTKYKNSGDEKDTADQYISNIYSADVWNAIKDAEPVPQQLADTTTVDDFDFENDYGIIFKATTLVTTSRTSIRLYFKVADESKLADVNVYCKNKKLSFTPYMNDYRYVEISGIAAKNIFDTYTITFTNGGNSISPNYCAANYYNYTLEHNNDAKTVAVLKAMYSYSDAAKKVLS